MKISFHGPVMRPRPGVLAEVEATPPEGTVDDLLAALGYSAEHRGHVVVLMEGRRLHPGDPIPAGEVDLMVMVPVGGGGAQCWTEFGWSGKRSETSCATWAFCGGRTNRRLNGTRTMFPLLPSYAPAPTVSPLGRRRSQGGAGPRSQTGGRLMPVVIPRIGPVARHPLLCSIESFSLARIPHE